VNASTTRGTLPAAATRAGRGSAAPAGRPFAALPHDIAADPRLSPTDVRVLLALLFWARAAAICWPSDPSIAARIGRSVGTVQRSLRKLAALGLIERRPTRENPTGRLILLRWRATPEAPAPQPPASAARDEGRIEREQERPGRGVGVQGPPPPAGDGGEEPPASAEDLARFEAWAASRDPALARFGRAALKLAGIHDCPSVSASAVVSVAAESVAEAAVEPAVVAAELVAEVAVELVAESVAEAVIESAVPAEVVAEAEAVIEPAVAPVEMPAVGPTVGPVVAGPGRGGGKSQETADRQDQERRLESPPHGNAFISRGPKPLQFRRV
jgi:hypothetical protein